MKTACHYILIFISLMLAGCNVKKNVDPVFILVNPSQVPRLFSEIGVLAKENGMVLNPGQASDDAGNTLRVLEAKNWKVRIWIQNMPLSGQEDVRMCGSFSEPHPDPGQYILTIMPRVPSVGREYIKDLRFEIINKLKEKGFSILKEPEICSVHAKKG